MVEATLWSKSEKDQKVYGHRLRTLNSLMSLLYSFKCALAKKDFIYTLIKARKKQK